MERYTYFDGGKWRLKIGDTEYSGKAVDRLAAYEDTGLEPEEIEQLKGEAFGLRVDKQELEQYRALGPIDRLRELAQADRDCLSVCVDSFQRPLVQLWIDSTSVSRTCSLST